MGKRENQVTTYIMVFTVSSFIGWLYETIITSIRWGTFAERGFLNSPICPIYGFGALLLLCLLRRFHSSVVIFLASTVVTTVVELVASYLLEIFLHKQLWTYKHWPLHFQGRISFFSSVLFGAFGVLLMKLVYPLVKVWVSKLEKRSGFFLSLWIVTLLGCDFWLCLMK